MSAVITRREVLRRTGALALGAVAAATVAACGNSTGAPEANRRASGIARVGWIQTRVTFPGVGPAVNARLQELGWLDGRSLHIDMWPVDQDATPATFAEVAANLAATAPDVVVAVHDNCATAMAKVTSTIPVVFLTKDSPVDLGLVAGYAAPGRNVTGITVDEFGDIAGKRLEVLKEALVTLQRVGIFYDPGFAGPAKAWLRTRAAASVLGVEALPFAVRDGPELTGAMERVRQTAVDALLVLAGGTVTLNAPAIRLFAISQRLPVATDTYGWFTGHGAFIFYGANDNALFLRLADYVDRVLRGTKPSDIPVERPSKFDLSLSLKAAREIGLTISPSVLARATEVLQ